MSVRVEREASPASLALPLVLLLGFGAMGAAQLVQWPAGSAISGPETVVVEARMFEHRLPGDFLQDGVPVNGVVVEEAFGPVEVMQRQVSQSDYRRCVAVGRCEPARPAIRSNRDDVPATGISHQNAESYARWLSEKTGQTWRLPTVAEWIFVAGERASDHALEVETDAANPADRWIAYYEQEAARRTDASAVPAPGGTFGANAFGVEDLAGNVWEWTATCANRTVLDSAGVVSSINESCGVRYLEGRHLTPMSVFVQDARGGGCSVGVPPDNLGFRLVREPTLLETLARRVGL